MSQLFWGGALGFSVHSTPRFSMVHVGIPDISGEVGEVGVNRKHF